MPSPTRSTSLSILASGLLGILVLTGCTGAPETAPTPGAGGPAAEASGTAPESTAEADEVLAAHGLAGLDARQVIEQLDATPVADRSTAFMASIRPDVLVISDASGSETSLDLPEDEFYVSIAPFVEQTHDCFFHSLTTCRGELANEAVDVEVVDDSGTVLVDETMTTFDNGFVGLWLPRDISGTITLELDGRTVTDRISTGADDPTCVTTLRLV